MSPHWTEPPPVPVPIEVQHGDKPDALAARVGLILFAAVIFGLISFGLVLGVLITVAVMR